MLTDSDGVLTDTGVYYSESGEAFKRFSIRDGMGVERLRVAGIDTGIITGEDSPSVRQRAAKLNLRHLYLGIRDKRSHLEVILKETGFSVGQLAYIGDDVNDLGIIQEIHLAGLTAAPTDAVGVIRRAVHYRTAARGGNGAFREFAEWILQLRTT